MCWYIQHSWYVPWPNRYIQHSWYVPAAEPSAQVVAVYQDARAHTGDAYVAFLPHDLVMYHHFGVLEFYHVATVPVVF